jgi:hypothetical protein
MAFGKLGSLARALNVPSLHNIFILPFWVESKQATQHSSHDVGEKEKKVEIIVSSLLFIPNLTPYILLLLLGYIYLTTLNFVQQLIGCTNFNFLA